MGVKNLWFPIALAILWVVMMAMAMADFASFNETTARTRVVRTHPMHSSQLQGRSVPIAMR
jgi:hypothetical protein